MGRGAKNVFGTPGRSNTISMKKAKTAGPKNKMGKVVDTPDQSSVNSFGSPVARSAIQYAQTKGKKPPEDLDSSFNSVGSGLNTLGSPEPRT